MFGGRNDIVYIDGRALRRVGDLHAHLGNAVPKAVQDALNETALESLKEMEVAFDAEIDRGPARFTEVHPGSSRSSVDRKRGRWAPGDPDIRASINVQRLQSSYLKYMLGVSPVRFPGDVGVARKKNFIPQDETDLAAQGVNLTAEGNLPGKAMQRLKAQENKARTERARYQLRLQAAKLAGKKAPKRKIPTRDEVFYGRPYRGTPEGWWRRQRTGGVKLLILAARRSRYPKPYLVPAWNRSVMTAANGLVAKAIENIEEAARQAATRTGAGGGSGGSTVP